jgi:LytS/YehU family sensor histidine kinase
MLIGFLMIVAGAALGLVVQRLTDRFPWPHPFRASFVAGHLVAAALYAVAWLVCNSLMESVLRGQGVIVIGPGLVPYLVLGVWLYVMVAGVSYATRATERAARAESLAVRSQLAALRSQLNPHFLFNALHTVVQLIPREPRQAADAAEGVAALLRTAIEEDRDLLPLGEELAFVERYLAVERIRFGERLRLRVDVSDEARTALVPPFALQTLVENAIRHGVAPRVEPTDVVITGSVAAGMLHLTVVDSGGGTVTPALESGNATGLRRLRERLVALYDGRARLDVAPGDAGGFTASLRLPVGDDD